VSTIVIAVLAIIALIVILSLIPGLQLLMKPIITLFFTLFQLLTEHVFSWFVWFSKRLLFAHLTFFKHLTNSDESLDPTIEARRAVRK
jgi:hypothetical protein